MEISLLVESFVGLVSILGVLIFFLLYSPSRRRKLELKEKEIRRVEKDKQKVGIEVIVDIIRDKKSTSDELSNALELIMSEYGFIDKFDIYGEILIRICKHPNTTKDIILNFNRDLENKNPKYKKEINNFVSKGLNAR